MTRGKILVTGAGGFIGGRVVETLHLHGREVRGAVRSWSSAARIGRFPVELVRCDVCRMDQVTQALDGCDAVVHCAVGNEAVTVEGTRNVLEAAQNTGVRRVVCLSTVDVYGEATGEVDETVPISAAGTGYATMKAAAERICEGFARKGVGVVVLRPTIVYGPFSKLWTVRFAERLASGQWSVSEAEGQGTCNLVYVDDLVAAILASLDSPGIDGESFNVNGFEQPTWWDYIDRLRTELGLSEKPYRRRGTGSRLKAQALMPIRRLAGLALSRYRDHIMSVYKRYTLAKRLFRIAEEQLKNTCTLAELSLYDRKVHYSIRKAARLLQYRPRYSVADGLQMSVAWLKHQGVLPFSFF